MLLHIDWETTGLPVRGAPSDDPRHPHPCSLSAILEDDNGKIWGELYTLIHVPAEAQWEPKAFEANKLTHDLCNRYGITLTAVMLHLGDMMASAETICAFNHHFDGKMIKVGAARLEPSLGQALRTAYEAKQGFCTMEASARHFVGPDARFIKLVLAYEKAFGRSYDGAHGAQADNRAQRELYHWLKAKGVADFGGTTVIGQKAAAPPLAAAAPLGAARPASGKPAAII